ncbi:hypothetical protein RHMOL_Rhmol10G0051100 [Rhododendron molle]|uniref:Uncharacterized protein n=1 Tax=Rhododendron molle TaxID=49168 RepID=A0ACC0LYT8_RHOML|nr:hypothetical protein RHMOL_Rhmol10G0051100 [Rhododendron molle]
MIKGGITLSLVPTIQTTNHKTFNFKQRLFDPFETSRIPLTPNSPHQTKRNHSPNVLSLLAHSSTPPSD